MPCTHDDPNDGETNPLLLPDMLQDPATLPPPLSPEERKRRSALYARSSRFDNEPADEIISRPEYWDKLL